MDESQELQQLANDPDLIVSVEIGGGYFEASIGDKGRGYRACGRTNTFPGAVRWLQVQARALYPQSQSVQELVGRVASLH